MLQTGLSASYHPRLVGRISNEKVGQCLSPSSLRLLHFWRCRSASVHCVPFREVSPTSFRPYGYHTKQQFPPSRRSGIGIPWFAIQMALASECLVAPVRVASAASHVVSGSGESPRHTRTGRATPPPKAPLPQAGRVAACEADPGVLRRRPS